MTITADSGSPLDDVRQRQHDLMTELRDVEHWRRLVAARLDLAVAAVTSLDEPAARLLPRALDRHGGAPVLPCGLRGIVGLPQGPGALPETAALVRLRDALRELDAYAAALRETTDDATRALVELLDPGISVHRAD